MNLEKYIYILDRWKVQFFLKSFSVRFDENLNTLFNIRISPFIILCEKNENLNNRRYLKGRMFKG